MWTLAHIAGMRPPGLLSWIAAIALFGGLFGVLVSRGRRRLLCGILALAGLGGTIDDWLVRGEHPARPDLVIRLVSPGSRSTDPVDVQVCGQTRAGAPAMPTANGRYLLVRVDGLQVAEAHSSSIAITMGRGKHLLSVEITSPDHLEFQPVLTLQRAVLVSGTGLPRIRACPPIHH